MLLVVLQCEYQEDGIARPRTQWYSGLWASHTGRRLRQMLPEGVEVVVGNATGRVGQLASDCFPPDPEHLRALLAEVKPGVVLACGRVAQRGLRDVGIDFIPAPHPAWRALSKQRIIEIRKELSDRLSIF